MNNSDRVLSAIGNEPKTVLMISDELGMHKNAVSTYLYALKKQGLAVALPKVVRRPPHPWRRGRDRYITGWVLSK